MQKNERKHQVSEKSYKKKDIKKKVLSKQIRNWIVAAAVIVVAAGTFGAQKYYTHQKQESLLQASLKTGVYRGISEKHVAQVGETAYRFREHREVLEPSIFRYSKQIQSYAAAQNHPDVMDQIYCFCQCDKSIGHKSLLSCFVDNHASMCGICQDEALQAAKLTEQGESIVAIIDAVDKEFRN